jgi:hypothetical protein
VRGRGRGREFVNTLAAELFRRADEVEELQRSLVEAAACLEFFKGT